MEITLEFLSPAFLYGADNKTKPEFRIPSLIGQMRYWWRMTQDWTSGDFAQFKKKEGKIFGIVDEKETIAKPFYIYLNQRPEIKRSPPTPPVMQNGQPKKGKFSFPTRNGNGVSYFFYPFMNHDGQFKWIPEGSKVRFVIDFQREDEKIPVLLSLFLLSRFGGLGTRSRRGAGAIELQCDCDLFKLTERHLKKYVNSEQKNSPGHEYFCLISQHSPLWQSLKNPDRIKKSNTSQADWESALNPVGAAMRSFRTKYGLLSGGRGEVDPDFVTEARILHQYFADPDLNSPPDPITKDAFGLPRILNFTSGRRPVFNALTITPCKLKNGKPEDLRRASPLHITVNRNGSQYYCTLITLWDGLEFLPAGSGIDIRVKHKDRKVSKIPAVQNPPADKLDAFLRSKTFTTI
ncbi:MAG: type III-B CRISPR module RAMP protein Cmr1 [Desulfotignum sp.]|nr:type III-B CRISPR module RAMP protein Cmr1 [Desulfotignum sp.]